MQKMICIPMERYERMVETYNEAMNELEEMKEALAEVMASQAKGRNSIPALTENFQGGQNT